VTKETARDNPAVEASRAQLERTIARFTESDAELSPDDYFALLAPIAARARDEGNYGIAAALVSRYEGIELVSVAGNSVFSESDPAGHAEVNAIRQASRVASAAADERHALLERGRADGSLLVRHVAQSTPSMILYATLEPCPMCTVCTINAGIDDVIIAIEDEPSGTMVSGRLERLPAMWPTLAQQHRLTSKLCQFEDPSDPSRPYLSPSIRRQLESLFHDDRDELDARLASEGVLEHKRLGEAARSHADQ
jgi:tRNA(Arg) A34 adenosine deaminase TadA